MAARLTLQRGLALTLLLATIGGPAGVLGVFHPFDDLTCLPFSADRPTTLETDSGDVHCPTCHLLRSLRWSLSALPDAGIAMPVALTAPLASLATGSDPAHFAIRGRSPPSSSTRPVL